MRASLVLFEDDGFVDLLPFTFWRSVFELSVGRKILLDRTAQRLKLSISGVWTRDWIARVAEQRCTAPANQPIHKGTILVNGRWLFNEQIEFPSAPSVGVVDGRVAYIVCDASLANSLNPETLLDAALRDSALASTPRKEAPGRLIRYPWDIVSNLSDILSNDWQPGDVVMDSNISMSLDSEQRQRLHVGENTRVHATTVFDMTCGPIFLSHDVSVGAHTVIEGPCYIGPGSRIHPHTWLHGGVAVGPMCKVGGEVCATVLNGYTNKQHTGFLGHAYVGSWVNIGAGASNSDLKNTYGRIHVPINGTEVDTGLQFFGSVIGDHVKLGINTSIPTGAVLGMAASVASTKILPKYVPSFGWVTDAGVRAGDVAKLLDVASAVMARRNVDMTDEEVELFLDLGDRVKTFEAPAR